MFAGFLPSTPISDLSSWLTLCDWIATNKGQALVTIQSSNVKTFVYTYTFHNNWSNLNWFGVWTCLNKIRNCTFSFIHFIHSSVWFSYQLVLMKGQPSIDFTFLVFMAQSLCEELVNKLNERAVRSVILSKWFRLNTGVEL